MILKCWRRKTDTGVRYKEGSLSRSAPLSLSLVFYLSVLKLLQADSTHRTRVGAGGPPGRSVALGAGAALRVVGFCF